MACIVQPTSLGSLHIESYAVHQASFSAKSPPIALSLDRVGTGWNVMGAAWGNRHFMPEGQAVVVNRTTGQRSIRQQ